MNKRQNRWTWFLIILLVSALVLAFRPVAGRAGEPPKDEASGEHNDRSRRPEGMSEMFQGTVAEVIRAGRHIYVSVDTEKRQVWVAVPAFEGNPGDVVLVPPGVQVANFQSKQLNRKFELIIFVGSIRRVGE
jgi:hypothetical protein